MSTVDRFIVPGTLAVALLAILAVTFSWAPRPTPPVVMVVTVGPPHLVPYRWIGLRFTPRNGYDGTLVLPLVPAQRRCAPITIVNSTLTYLDQTRACRLKDGSYKLRYRFPAYDDYIAFAEMQPAGGAPGTYRLWLPLDRCAVRYRGRRRCGVAFAYLRGREAVRSQAIDNLTVVLAAPAHTLIAPTVAQVSLIFLRDGRAVPDLQPVAGPAGDLLALAMNTKHMARFHPDRGQVVHGYIVGGAITYSGGFDQPSIYLLDTAVRYRRRTLRISFVIDVDPPPVATSSQ